MRVAFYASLACLALFEVIRVYLIMPTLGTNNEESLDIAYFLDTYEWHFRITFILMAATGGIRAFRARPIWLPGAAVVALLAIVWFCNFSIAPENVFEQAEQISFKPRSEARLDDDSQVIGVVRNGEAKAYPIRYLIYHHQVRDTVGGKRVMVTYCNICRTARVHEPVINGRLAKFRLVGVNRGNSIYEDSITRSWWLQATGEAMAGPQDGKRLQRVESVQLSARKWFELHPASLMLQPDGASAEHYALEDTQGFETGAAAAGEPAPLQDDSWVVGVELGGASKAYDWARLKAERVVNDDLGGKPIVLVLGADGRSFAAFERPEAAQHITVNDSDVLSSGGISYDFSGRSLSTPTRRLSSVPASRELWKCWREFHPEAA